jgi:hypothetical protein
VSKPKRKRDPQPFYKKSHKACYVQVGKAQHRLAADSRDAPIWRPGDVKRFDTIASLKNRQTIRFAMAKLAKASSKRKASGCLP